MEFTEFRELMNHFLEQERTYNNLKFGELEKKIKASALDVSKAFDENISSINRKSQALAKIIDKSKKDIELMTKESEKDYSFLHGVTTRLAQMDQQIKALQNGKANAKN